MKQVIAFMAMRNKTLKCTWFSVHEDTVFYYLYPSQMESTFTQDREKTFDWDDKKKQAKELDFINRWAPYRVYDLFVIPDKNVHPNHKNLQGSVVIRRPNGFPDLVNSDGTRVKTGQNIY